MHQLTELWCMITYINIYSITKDEQNHLSIQVCFPLNWPKWYTGAVRHFTAKHKPILGFSVKIYIYIFYDKRECWYWRKTSYIDGKQSKTSLSKVQEEKNGLKRPWYSILYQFQFTWNILYHIITHRRRNNPLTYLFPSLQNRKEIIWNSFYTMLMGGPMIQQQNLIQLIKSPIL